MFFANAAGDKKAWMFLKLAFIRDSHFTFNNSTCFMSPHTSSFIEYTSTS